MPVRFRSLVRDAWNSSVYSADRKEPVMKQNSNLKDEQVRQVSGGDGQNDYDNRIKITPIEKGRNEPGEPVIME